MPQSEQNNYEFNSGAVFGSLAYDFTHPEFYTEFTMDEPIAQAPPEVEERVEPKAQTAARPVARPLPKAVVATVGCFAVVGVLLCILLNYHIQLAGISDNSAHLQEEIGKLKTQQDMLLITYESAFNLAEIEEYAIGTLGMQKPRNDQIFYIDNSSPDLAVVLTPEEGGGGFMDSFGDLISSLGEYFGK